MAKTTTKQKKKETKTVKNPVKTIDQLTFARIIAQKYELTINTVLDIILEEQKLTMKYVDDGYKVIKKNYLTLEPRTYESKTWISPLDKKTYEFAERKRVIIRVGDGFKNYLNKNKKQDDKLCRFVATTEREENLKDLLEIT